MDGGSLKLAVLIDGDNISADAMDRLFATIATLGDPIIRIVYGGQTSSKKWKRAGIRHALSFVRRHPQAARRNATDIEMVIGAMDILGSSQVDGFCLVSSDADFTALAIRLRESGKIVHGWGPKAPECLKNACHRFHALNDEPSSAATGNILPFPQTGMEQAVAGIRRAIKKYAAQDGWAAMSSIGIELKREIPGFDYQNYGAASLKTLALKAGCFDVQQADGGHAAMRDR